MLTTHFLEEPLREGHHVAVLVQQQLPDEADVALAECVIRHARGGHQRLLQCNGRHADLLLLPQLQGGHGLRWRVVPQQSHVGRAQEVVHARAVEVAVHQRLRLHRARRENAAQQKGAPLGGPPLDGACPRQLVQLEGPLAPVCVLRRRAVLLELALLRARHREERAPALVRQRLLPAVHAHVAVVVRLAARRARPAAAGAAVVEEQPAHVGRGDDALRERGAPPQEELRHVGIVEGARELHQLCRAALRYVDAVAVRVLHDRNHLFHVIRGKVVVNQAVHDAEVGPRGDVLSQVAEHLLHEGVALQHALVEIDAADAAHDPLHHDAVALHEVTPKSGPKEVLAVKVADSHGQEKDNAGVQHMVKHQPVLLAPIHELANVREPLGDESRRSSLRVKCVREPLADDGEPLRRKGPRQNKVHLAEAPQAIKPLVHRLGAGRDRRQGLHHRHAVRVAVEQVVAQVVPVRDALQQVANLRGVFGTLHELRDLPRGRQGHGVLQQLHELRVAASVARQLSVTIVRARCIARPELCCRRAAQRGAPPPPEGLRRNVAWRASPAAGSERARAKPRSGAKPACGGPR
ncbi:hypothetical protein STCU_03352 [Strigomonas culicis]|uniref:Uncharacterized protein n=1 Tax=Strigomonas culicis TaxID=28005 RepID=S9US96_9TRYP|nr:hypothetical protein STCU_03352 [Strigomonas culicis]|eukprot:EPY31644.1 hypothetical protein STCU_03352 [Strigomonas culicis]